MEVPEHLTESGAAELATRIRLFWGAYGLEVTVWTEAIQVGGRSTVHVVQSDLLNGLPRQISRVSCPELFETKTRPFHLTSM